MAAKAKGRRKNRSAALKIRAAGAAADRLGSAATAALLQEYSSIDKGFGKGLVVAGKFRPEWYGFIEVGIRDLRADVIKDIGK